MAAAPKTADRKPRSRERDSGGGLYWKLIPQAFSTYRHVDPILMPWAVRHGIAVETEERGWDLRSFWICDRDGYRRGQIWLRDPDRRGNVTVIASELDPKSATNWGAREERRASRHNLEAILDELWFHMLAWGGSGAIAENNGRYPENLQRYVPRWGHERWPQPHFSRNRLGSRERLGLWISICLLLHLLSWAFNAAPENTGVGRLAVTVAEAVTIWPLLAFTSLILPGLLFFGIVAPQGPFRRAFLTGLIAAALMMPVTALLVWSLYV